MVYEKSHS
jgi:hypothetical protein